MVLCLLVTIPNISSVACDERSHRSIGGTDKDSAEDYGPESDSFEACGLLNLSESTRLKCSNSDKKYIDPVLDPVEQKRLLNEKGAMPKSAKELREFSGPSVKSTSAAGFNDMHVIDGAGVAYVESGDDVLIHLARLHKADNFESSRAIITVLQDYRETKAILKNLSPNRESIEHSVSGTAATFPINDTIEQYDIRVPATSFGSPGRYTIQLNLSGTGVPNTQEYSREFVVFYGGCEPERLSCADVETVREPNAREKRILRDVAVDTVIYRSDSGDTKLREPTPISPGEQVEFRFSTLVRDKDEYVVFVPLLDGKPVHDPIHQFLPGKKESYGSQFPPISDSEEFEVKFPTESGIYRVELAQFQSAYLTGQEAESLGLSTVPFKLGSNSLRFSVEGR